MAFVERFTSLKSAVPFRCYVDESEFEKAFGSIENARKHIFSIVKENEEMFKGRDYLIAVLYGFQNQKTAEVYGYKKIGANWPGNTEVLTWIFENGIYKPNENYSCGNMDIVKGEEEKHRRGTPSLADFLRTVPHLGELHPLKDSGIVEYKP